MQIQCSDARDRLVAKYGEDALRVRTPSTERFEVEMYIDYWFAGLFAAMEGYEKLSLTDPEVENLLDDPLYGKLRAYRGGVYHFQEKYFDDAIRNFLADANSFQWMMRLNVALGNFVLAEVKKINRDAANAVGASR